MKILVYSSMNVDCTFAVDHINLPGETQSSTTLRKTAGGKGANQAYAIAKAAFRNIKVFFAGKGGADGDFILDKLHAVGVSTEYVYRTEHGTGQAIIQLDRSGQNSIILFGGGNQEITKQEIDTVLSNFDSNDVLVMNGEINNLDHLLMRAAEKGIKVFINPSPVNEAIRNLSLEKASGLIFNEIEGQSFCGLEDGSSYEDILKSLMKKYPDSEIVLTVGSEGSYYGFRNETVLVPSLKVNVVDTTGAGDIFLGFFVVSRLSGKSARKSMEIATKAASIAVSRPGTMDSVPDYSEVD